PLERPSGPLHGRGEVVCSCAGKLCGSVQVSMLDEGMSPLLCRWHRQGWEQLARFVGSGEPPASYQRSSSCGWSRCQGHARYLHDPVSAFDQGDLNKERLTSPGKWFSHDHCACPVRTSFPLERYTLTHSSDPSFFPIDRILIRVRATVV